MIQNSFNLAQTQASPVLSRFICADSSFVHTCFCADSQNSIEVFLRNWPLPSPWSLGRLQIPTLVESYSKFGYKCFKTFDFIKMYFFKEEKTVVF